MNEQELRKQIADEIRAMSFPEPPAGNPVFEMLKNAMESAKNTIAAKVEVNA